MSGGIPVFFVRTTSVCYIISGNTLDVNDLLIITDSGAGIIEDKNLNTLIGTPLISDALSFNDNMML